MKKNNSTPSKIRGWTGSNKKLSSKSKFKSTVGFVGAGNMATAIAEGLNDEVNLIAYDPNPNKSKGFKNFGNILKSIEEVYDQSDLVIFAVKPQDFDSIPECEKPVWSLLAGVNLKKLEKKAHSKILRVMPSLSVAQNKSAILITGETTPLGRRLLKILGTPFEITENDFFELSLIAGSMPALIATYLNGIKNSLSSPISEETKTQLIQTAFEAVKIDEPYENLISRVASPGGITEQFLSISSELEKITKLGIEKATKRCKELGN